MAQKLLLKVVIESNSFTLKMPTIFFLNRLQWWGILFISAQKYLSYNWHIERINWFKYLQIIPKVVNEWIFIYRSLYFLWCVY
jgi:hypothetical protein